MDLAISGSVYMNIGSAHSMRVLTIDPYDQESIDDSFALLSLPHDLQPHTSYLLATAEPVKVPLHLVGLIGLRSTWARLGLLAPLTVADPGFEGTLTLEVYNAGGRGILVQPGDKIFSMTYVTADRDEPAYEGRYQGQTGLTLPKALVRE